MAFSSFRLSLVSGGGSAMLLLSLLSALLLALNREAAVGGISNSGTPAVDGPGHPPGRNLGDVVSTNIRSLVLLGEEDGGVTVRKLGVERKSELADEHCVQVPVAKPYECEKEEEVEKAYACNTKIEREMCEYRPQEIQQDCYRLRKEVIQYPCFTTKKDKICWLVPEQKEKKCKKSVKKQLEVRSQRIVRREKCVQKPFEVDALCHRPVELSMAYMCYRRPPKICKRNKIKISGKCKETIKEKEPYSCRRTGIENRCILPGNCKPVQIMRNEMCYRDIDVVVEKDCMKDDVEEVCESPDPMPDTCEKKIPSLKEYKCTSLRHQEECDLEDIAEDTSDYIDEELVETFDCPYIHDGERCADYEAIVSRMCEKEVEQVEKYLCPHIWYKEVCDIKQMTTPHTCYSVSTVKRKLTCYQVEYEMACLSSAEAPGPHNQP